MKTDSKCPECGAELKRVMVSVEGAKNKALSFQCPKCDYFRFDRKSGKKVVDELKFNEALDMKQKIIKLSKDRLGMYFNKDVIRSLNLQSGKDVYVSVPDKKHIILSL